MKATLIALALSLGLLVPADEVVALAPQAPVAAGPFSSLPEVLDAAHRCRIDDLKIRTYGIPRLSGFELFLLEDTRHASCLVTWQTRNGRLLNLKPRWWRDDFTRDSPNAR